MKLEILNELKVNMSKFVSGEYLSKTLGVSRTSIWKYINEFKKEGYNIVASSKKGYMLVSEADVISANEISHGLKTELLGKRIYSFDTIDSTNIYAKKLGNENCQDGTIVVADSQTEGRGRLGRQWSSAPGKGIWISVVLKPEIPPENAQIITIAAAVAVVAALEKSVGIKAGIKWPNDIILDGKKVCGILTEMNAEMDRINYIVLGIGINVSQSLEDFPENLKNLATSLKINLYEKKKPAPCSLSFKRSEIIQSLLYELERIYSKISKGLFTEVIEEWKINSVTLGREVRLLSKNTEITGVAININNNGKLVVKGTGGELIEVNSGEVSVKGILGEL